MSNEDNDYFDKIVEKLVSVSGKCAVVESSVNYYINEIKRLEEERNSLYKKIAWQEELLKQEKIKAELADNKWRELYTKIGDYKKAVDTPNIKNVIKTFLMILIKEKILTPSKSEMISMIRIFHHMTGDSLINSKKFINETIESVKDISIKYEQISDDDIKDQIAEVSKIENKVETKIIESKPNLAIVRNSDDM